MNEELAHIAASQASTFSRGQALNAGVSDDELERRAAAGWLTREGPGVFGIAGVTPSWRRSLWIAHLTAGPLSWISHEAAAAIHGLEGFPRRKVVLTVKHPDHARVRGAIVHQSTDIEERWTMRKPGYPAMATPARVFVELAAVCRYPRLFTALDGARADGIVDTDAVAVALHAVARRGKPGVRVLGQVLDALGSAEPLPSSKLERLLFGTLETAGLPKAVRQFTLPGRQLVEGCVDGAYVDAMMILEADGRRWHARSRDMARDRQRDNEAAAAGYVTLRFMHEELKSDPEGVVDVVRETRRVRLALLAA